jgi:hypothetical protein
MVGEEEVEGAACQTKKPLEGGEGVCRRWTWKEKRGEQS